MAQDKFKEADMPFEHRKATTPAPKSKATVKLKKIGNSLGVTLPKKLLDKNSYSVGTEFTIIELEDGLKLIPYDAEFEHKMEIARRIMREHRDVLRELAK